ncbi:MAG: molecular chaperone DnaJ [Clostridia bacterium]|nr:molecular chaperone DnaJ [Clostridia bacterium]
MKGLDYINMKWFKDCKTIEEAKELYKKLCREYHPDMNESDTTEAMKSINNEFEQVFKTLKNKHRSEDTDTTTDNKENGTETPAEFMNIINTLVSCEGLTIELVGRWIWLTGNTYPYKDIIKSLNFRWANAKKAWYFRNEADACKSRKKLSLDEIKEKYGCQSFAGVSIPKLATA